MRIAVVLAIMARSIDKHIFQPTYIKDEEDVIRILLVRLAGTNSKMESFGRALLLAIFPDEQARNATKAVGAVIKEIWGHVEDLLFVAQYDSFRSGLEQVVQQAHDAWQIVQHAKEKFEPNFELSSSEEIEWQVLTFEDADVGVGEQSLTRASGGDEPLLVIIPCIYIIEDANPYPFANGVVLTKSQSKAATEEMERKNPSSPTTGRMGPRPRPNRSRTKSVSNNGGNGFLSGTTPSSLH
jgi:hypothetical protein